LTDLNQGYEGGCTCGHVRYQVSSAPMIVQSCHCTRCQRQAGTAFATNAAIEADRVTLLAGDVKCMIAVWGHYFSGGVKEKIRFIRVGTLDDPSLCPPDIHIFTGSKQPWIDLPSNVKAVSAFYDLTDVWPADSIKRRAAVFEAAGISMS